MRFLSSKRGSSFLLLVSAIQFSGLSQTLPYTVTTMPESSGTYAPGMQYPPCISQSSNPQAPFYGQSVTFLGWQSGGSGVVLNGAHLIYRFQIAFPQPVQLNSVTVTGGGDYASGGSNAVLRLLDQSENVLGSLSTTYLQYNCPVTYTLSVSGASGQTFYIDEFDYSTVQRFRSQITIAFTGSCTIPTAESTSFAGWNQTEGKWYQQVSDSDGTDFSLSNVKEVNAGGAFDSCWFEGSMYPKVTGITSIRSKQQWTISPGNIWGLDLVGWTEDAVNYYRSVGRAPCAFRVNQQMLISCPLGNPALEPSVPYGQVNILLGIVQSNTVTSCRAGKCKKESFTSSSQ